VTRFRLRISLRAAQQIDAASAWWRKHRHKAPEALDDDVAEAFELIRENPGVGTLVRRRPRHVRKIYLERVGYFLYYAEPIDGIIEVGALWHASRRSRPRF
jgi:plasmid stabilization system protein ParE